MWSASILCQSIEEALREMDRNFEIDVKHLKTDVGQGRLEEILQSFHGFSRQILEMSQLI